MQKLVVGYTITRNLNDDEQVIAESIPTLDLAEVIQTALYGAEKGGADYEIGSIYSRDFQQFINAKSYTSHDVDCDAGLYKKLQEEFNAQFN